MKLSSSAKEYIKAEVRAASADDLKAADAALAQERAKAEKTYDEFKTAYEKLKAKFAKEVDGLIKDTIEQLVADAIREVREGK